ncbi:MAG: type II toxin-antitoxin system HicA family toxin [Bacteroidetes bacterium]|nr:type II toxin-antitoxin system HicA family toxin [Bacteroidota bacterium]
MKRSLLIHHLEEQGCFFSREGAKHSIYKNPVNGKKSTIPRHTEIINILAQKICKDLGIPSP